jgi:hypothetical protein
MRTVIIAEAGVNHNGSIETAKKMVDAAIVPVFISRFNKSLKPNTFKIRLYE